LAASADEAPAPAGIPVRVRARPLLATVALRLQNRARMRRASLLAVLALPALAAAETVPTPATGSGKITYATQALTPFDQYINKAECLGGKIKLQWSVAFTSGTGGSLTSYQLYASDHASDMATKDRCPTQNDDLITGAHAGSVGDPIAAVMDLTDPSPILEFDTDAIASVAGLGACTASSTDILLCVQAKSGSTNIGVARTTLTLATTPPGDPASASGSPGEEAVEVSWGDSGEPTPEYHIAEVVTGPAVDPTQTTSTSKSSGAVASTGAGSTRIEGLQNGVVYQVWVTAYSTADNASDPVFGGTVSPEPVNNFWELYHDAAHGREQGGCSTGAGAAGALGILAAASLLAFRRRT